MHAVLFHLAAATPEPSSTGLVLPKGDEFIWALIAFAFLFFALWKFAFPALKKGLDAREQAIRGELERAEQSRLEAESKREEYDRRIADARSEADRIVREANESIEAMRRDRIARAEDEARQILEKARADAATERERAFSELQRTVADLSLEAARRVIEQELQNPDVQRQLVERFIQTTGQTAGTNN